MKKLITIATLLLVAAIAQGQSKYDNRFKYGLLSNLEIGVGGIYSYEITNKAHHKNVGAQLLLTKRIGDFWRIRGTAEVNGFIPNGFDRKGKGMVGLSFDLLPFYLFVDYGACLNPSAKSKLGLAMDAGAGLQFKIGKVSSLYVEGGVDRTYNGGTWQSVASVKAGYMTNLGVTESDKVEIEHDHTIRSEYGELKGENKLLKSELQKCQDATTSIQESAIQMAAMVETLTAQLEKKESDHHFLQDNCGSIGDWNIYFTTGSCHITSQMDDVIADIAEIMLGNNKHYKIDGFASNNGSPLRNIELAQGRAEAVFQRLVEYGVDPIRLLYSGNGATDYDRQADQRVFISPITNN
jgi:outer membrane protein OmpA-like peptidoglycan-associated protein